MFHCETFTPFFWHLYYYKCKFKIIEYSLSTFLSLTVTNYRYAYLWHRTRCGSFYSFIVSRPLTVSMVISLWAEHCTDVVPFPDHHNMNCCHGDGVLHHHPSLTSTWHHRRVRLMSTRRTIGAPPDVWLTVNRTPITPGRVSAGHRLWVIGKHRWQDVDVS